MTDSALFLAVTALASVIGAGFVVLVWLKLRVSGGPQADVKLDQIIATQERFERTQRAEHLESQRQLRTELAESSRALRVEIAQADAEFRSAVARDAAAGRSEGAESLARFAASFSAQWQSLIQTNDQRMGELRAAVEQRLLALQIDNAGKLDEMRRTVDEKLHATLELRLGESFKQVSERLEAVQRGLGEMQVLATGVGDLKRVLTNVKTRGTWGEVQLARLIEDGMTPEQYAKNVKTVPGSDAQVEFAIRLPGSTELDQTVWLPIDAKFPKEEYERLMDAHEHADRDGIKMAGLALGKAVETQAKLIVSKYVSPPHTTDFAIMFLPSESLYAEVLRQPGLLDKLHDLRVNVAGPANLAALLNSLQMGFRTLAIQQRSSEVWRVLRAVKTEFNKFGDTLANVKKSLDTASNRIGQTETRTRAMLRSLKDVEAMPDEEARALLREGLSDTEALEADSAQTNLNQQAEDQTPPSESDRG
jgi:DNA recombination protein RmuC